MDLDLIGGIDGDALPERQYNIKSDAHKCVKCGRSLKGKIAYLTSNDNDLICTDTKTDAQPAEALLCELFTILRGWALRHSIKIPKSTIKKIEKALKDVLE